MIELASKAWKFSIVNTMRKAREMGVEMPVASTLESSVASYVKHIWEPRQRVREFWSIAQKCYGAAESPNLRYLQGMLGAKDNMGRSWVHHGGQFVGAAHRRVADMGFTGPSNGNFQRGSKLFKGKGWEDLICIPFQDLPGRICACLFVGRHAKRENGDFVFKVAPEFMWRATSADKKVSGSIYESGLAMMDTAWSPPRPDLQGHIFIFDDPWLAVRLQLKWMRTHTVPLPIISTYSDERHETQKVWDWLPLEKAICWSPTPGVKVIDSARRARASVSQFVVSPRTLDKNLKTEKPLTWLRSFARNAVTWDVALRKEMQSASHHEIEEILLELGLTGPAMRNFLESCDPDLRARVEKIYEQRTRLNRIRIASNRIVHETEDGLFVDKACISTAIIRIEQVLQARAGRSYYRGYILFNGDRIPFTERTDAIDSGIWKWCREYLRGLSVGIPTFNTSYAKHALEMTFMFHQPKFVEGVDAVGWDNDRRQFNFPRFAIKATGEVVNDYACLFTDESVPGRNLGAPEQLSRKAISTLSERNDEVAVFWATAACVLNNILAPAMHYRPAGIILSGQGSHSIGHVSAVEMGCPERTTLWSGSNHQWPAVLDWGGSISTALKRWYTKKPQWFVSDEAKQAIVSVPATTSRVFGIKQTWNIIHCPRRLGSMQLVSGVISRILPAYLQDLCSRRMWIVNNRSTEVENIIHDMAGWFELQGGSPAAINDASKMLRLREQYPAVQHFVELLFLINTEGRLGMRAARWQEEKQRINILTSEDKKTAWVPQQAFSAAVEDSAGLPPDVLLITKALQAEGCLIGEESMHNDRGWVIDNTWLNQVWNKCKDQLGEPE